MQWRHSCFVKDKINCNGPDDPTCPWYNITRKVDALYQVEWPVSEMEKQLRPKLKRGTRVRFRPDLVLFDGRIRPGQTGTFNQTSTGVPPVQIIWDKWDGPTTVNKHYQGSYYVHWEQLEILPDAEQVVGHYEG